MAIQQTLQQLAQNQVAPAPVPASISTPAPPTIEPIHEELAHGFTPKDDNHSPAQRPVNVAEELTIFVMRTELDALM